jgi:hypothetical protein
LRRCAIRRSRRKGREEGRRRGADRWGPGVSDHGKKKRREGDEGRCGEGGNGLVGRCAKRVREVRLSFFLFLFKSFSNQTICIQIQIKLFKLFHRIL